jgi:hypothetical protein
VAPKVAQPLVLVFQDRDLMVEREITQTTAEAAEVRQKLEILTALWKVETDVTLELGQPLPV